MDKQASINSSKNSKSYISIWNEKKFDKSVFVGLVTGILVCFSSLSTKVTEHDSLILGLFVGGIFWLCQYFLEPEHLYVEERFELNINALIFQLYQAGLELKLMNNNTYLFKTTNIVCPNDSFVVAAHPDYCTLIGEQGALKRLRFLVELKDIR